MISGQVDANKIKRIYNLASVPTVKSYDCIALDRRSECGQRPPFAFVRGGDRASFTPCSCLVSLVFFVLWQCHLEDFQPLSFWWVLNHLPFRFA